MNNNQQIRTAIEQIVRAKWGRIIAALTARFSDIDLAEEAMQDALIAALAHWPHKGIPANPQGWLFQTAKHKAIDRLRRASTRTRHRAALTHQGTGEPVSAPEIADLDHPIEDERLRLIFTCCHPALPRHVHTALALKTICGLNIKQIAAAYLVSETSMAQRIVRAKRKIKQAKIPFIIPGPDLWPERWASVLAVVYLIFNEGHLRVGAEQSHPDLCHQALDLGRILVTLLPDEPEAAGLLSLMLLNDARRPARLAKPGQFIALEHQDRALWDKDKISQGDSLLIKALTKSRIGPYQLQAAISALHSTARTYQQTDWYEITALYTKLYAITPTPVVRLNASIAMSYAIDPRSALAALRPIAESGVLDNYQPYHATRADMLRRDGQKAAAQIAYNKAISLTQNLAERRYLQEQCARL